MSTYPTLTRYDRACRHQRLVAAYQAGHCSRTVASLFGLSDGHVRNVLRVYGVARKPGRPAIHRGPEAMPNKRSGEF